MYVYVYGKWYTWSILTSLMHVAKTNVLNNRFKDIRKKIRLNF